MVHNSYQQAGGEDTVLANERALRLSLAPEALSRRRLGAAIPLRGRLIPLFGGQISAARQSSGIRVRPK
jgi:septal ring factor EnvC (AmiA/AmiB activator)